MAQHSIPEETQLQTKNGYVEHFFRVTPTRNAAFISKLYSMVDDESTKELITWTGNGDQFTVFDNTEFSRVVLPRYFKHCNWSSFVRQLNMYDFHKVNEGNSDEDSPAQRWDFKHPWFSRSGIDRLHRIRRKPPRNRLMPQMRYSSAMEIVPTNSPESDKLQSNTPVVHEAISQLQDSVDLLETKIDHACAEVQYLRTVTDNQQQTLDSLTKFVDVLKAKFGLNKEELARKPRKVYECKF
ncbi:winged helix DNA-binding domain-containing protein [Backusella circina FSU 941]|nr:winged helix DNA-binding domain-containing protein [Backusella circina FSU 941]